MTWDSQATDEGVLTTNSPISGQPNLFSAFATYILGTREQWALPDPSMRKIDNQLQESVHFSQGMSRYRIAER